jgi:hypothetical protein
MSAGADASSAGGEPYFVVAEEPCTFARFSIPEFHRHFGNLREVAETAQMPSPHTAAASALHRARFRSEVSFGGAAGSHGGAAARPLCLC